MSTHHGHHHHGHHHHGHHHGTHSHAHAHAVSTNATDPSTTGDGMFHETGHSGQHMLFFHLNNKIIVLFQEWEIASIAVLIGSCVAIFALALLYEGLKQVRARHERRYTRPRPQEEQPHGGDVEKVTSNGSAFGMEDAGIRQSSRLRIFTCFHVIQTLMHVLQTAIHFLLMLVVMTYNVWLCIAVVAGAGLGYFLMAGLLAERVPRPPRTKTSGSVFALKKRTRTDGPDADPVEEPGNSAADVTGDVEKTDGKDDNQNADDGQTGNGSAVLECSGNGSAIVDTAGSASATDGDSGDKAEKTEEPENKEEEQNVEVRFGEEKSEKEDSGNENPAFEEDQLPSVGSSHHMTIPPEATNTTE